MRIFAIFMKEMCDTLRDRRTLLSSFAYVLMGPLAVVFTVNVLAEAGRPSALAPVALCAGAAPSLVEHLEAAGLVFAPAAEVCIGVPDDFDARLAAGNTVHVDIRGDLTDAGATVTKLETEIGRYSRVTAVQRAVARGVAPSVITPIVVERQNTNAVSRQADVIARLLILFFVMTPFFVSAAAAADMTAGERERRCLEPLLAFPVGTLRIVLGKWLAATAIGVVGTGLCVSAGLGLMARSALPELGIRLATGPGAVFTAWLLLLPLCGLAAALQVAIAWSAKSYKDAQSYLMLLTFAPAVAGFVLAGERLVAASAWPVAWELAALRGPLLDAAAAPVAFAQIAAMELSLAAAVLVLAAAQLRSERVLLQS